MLRRGQLANDPRTSRTLLFLFEGFYDQMLRANARAAVLEDMLLETRTRLSQDIPHIVIGVILVDDDEQHRLRLSGGRGWYC